jgi:predicted GIY-YIG superfamily endonuclease
MYGYKIEIPATPEMIYIGQTKDLEKRWSAHCNSNNTSLISRALQAYGPGTITKIYEAISEKDLDRWEIDTIKKLNTIYPGGYNLHPGGKSGRGGYWANESRDVTIADEQEEENAFEKRKNQKARVVKIVGNIKYMEQVVKAENVSLEHIAHPMIMKGRLGYGFKGNTGETYRKITARSGSDWSNYVESVLGKWHRNEENNGTVNVWDLTLKEWDDLEQKILLFFNRHITPSLPYL